MKKRPLIDGNKLAPPAGPFIIIPVWLERILDQYGVDAVRTALADVFHARLRETLKNVTADMKLEDLQKLVTDLHRGNP